MKTLALLLVLMPQAAPDKTLVLTGGRILTPEGREVRGTVVIQGSRIVSVSENLEPPAGAAVIDVSGKFILPGLIDANSTLGIEGPADEDGDEVTANVRTADSLDPRSPALERARKRGITTVYVGPGNRNVIGGLGAVIKTSALTKRGMLLAEDAALKAAVGSGPSFGNYPPRGSSATFFARRPTTRMGVAWEFRKAFLDARKGGDPEREILLRALEGKLTVRIAASRATDIETALEMAGELGLTVVLEEAQEAWKRVEVLAKRKIPVLLRPSVSLLSLSSGEGTEGRLDSFLLLEKAGVKTALLPIGEGEFEGPLAMAAFAVRHGAGRESALRAITLVPAEILGVADRVGSLEKGKDADLVVLSGDPLDLTTRIERVMIGGRWVSGERTDK